MARPCVQSAAVLQPQRDCYLVTTVVAGAPHAVRPHLDREMLARRGVEAGLEEERGLACEGEHLGKAVRAGFPDQGVEQRASQTRPLPVRVDRQASDLGQLERVDLER